MSFGGPVSFVDVAAYPALAGLALGRLSAVALDDPASIGKLSNLLIVRSGVEFWPGVLAAALVVAVIARRDRVNPAGRLADIAPLSLVGYASYEATCVFRDGCFGPPSPFGLTPPGVATPMLPVGLLVAVVVAGAAFGVRAMSQRGSAPIMVVFLAAASVAGSRAVASFWLPHVGASVTRQHATSLVAATALTGALAIISWHTHRQHAAVPARTDDAPAADEVHGEPR